MICPLSPVSMLIFTSGPSWLCHSQTFQLAPLLYMFFPTLMLTFPLHTSNLLQLHTVFKHTEDDADYRSRLTFCLAPPNLSLSLSWLHKSQTEVLEFCGTLFVLSLLTPSLSHTMALTSAGLDPGLTCCPKLPKVFPSFHQSPTATSSPCPQWLGLCTQEVPAAFRVLPLTLLFLRAQEPQAFTKVVNVTTTSQVQVFNAVWSPVTSPVHKHFSFWTAQL